MNIFKLVYNLFLTLILAFVLLLVFSLTPPGKNFKILAVLSGSMEPAIHVGGIVAVNRAVNYEIGDVITFGKISKTDIPVTHRVIDIKTGNGTKFFITKGDANNAADSNPVAQSEIDGKVLFTLPLLGFVLSYLKTPAGLALLIIIPAGAIVWEESKKIRAELKKSQNKAENA